MRFLHAERTHPVYVEGCFACSLGTIGVGSVPGGTRPGSMEKWTLSQMKKNLRAYEGARKNGLRPSGTTVAAVEQAERDAESFQRGAEKLGFRDYDAFDREVKANG